MTYNVIIYRRGSQRPRRVGPATVTGPPKSTEELHVYSGKRKGRAPKIVIAGRVVRPPINRVQ